MMKFILTKHLGKKKNESIFNHDGGEVRILVLCEVHIFVPIFCVLILIGGRTLLTEKITALSYFSFEKIKKIFFSYISVLFF